ncbi:GNAT family N-acetyltransferase [Sphingomonas sp. R86521]|uniref:GNAT family N-acetyltransferase n=1 Tax=Sphingomonas sp. R86521 TaxID=3093860 RepID=UPI0036D3380F
MNLWTETPTLAGRHVTLRPLDRADGPALVAAASADGLWDLFYAGVAKLKDIDGWFAEVFAEQSYGRAVAFTVLDAAGETIGTTRLMRMSEQNRRLEIGGTFYATRAQRTGANTEAKLLLLTHAFDRLGCQSVQIRTDALNRRSQAAIERLGARRDGVLRGHQVTATGRLRDTVVYSILAHEWPGVRQNLMYLLARHEDCR